MQRDIEFRTEDGVILRGWHYLPEGAGPFYVRDFAASSGASCEWFREHPLVTDRF